MMRNLTMKPVDLLCYPTLTFLKNLFYRTFLFGLFAGWVESWTKRAIRLFCKECGKIRWTSNSANIKGSLLHACDIMNVLFYFWFTTARILKKYFLKSIYNYPNLILRINRSSLKVLGEYSYTASEYEPQVILEQLFSLLERKFEGKGRKFTSSWPRFCELGPWWTILYVFIYVDPGGAFCSTWKCPRCLFVCLFVCYILSRLNLHITPRSHEEKEIEIWTKRHFLSLCLTVFFFVMHWDGSCDIE